MERKLEWWQIALFAAVIVCALTCWEMYHEMVVMRKGLEQAQMDAAKVRVNADEAVQILRQLRDSAARFTGRISPVHREEAAKPETEKTKGESR